MPITDLIPWKRKESEPESERGALQVRQDPILTFQQQMNRTFDDFFRGWGLQPFGTIGAGWDAFSPRVDVVETEKAIEISAELPGLDQKDIDVALSRNVLTICGQKREEKEKKGRNCLRVERAYGSFRRSIPLPSGVDTSKVDAAFRNGVLTITLPKTIKPEARERNTIKAL